MSASLKRTLHGCTLWALLYAQGLLGAQAAHAQEPRRLPPIRPSSEWDLTASRADALAYPQPAQYLEVPPGAHEPVVVLDDPESSPARPSGNGRGVLQSVQLTATWVPPLNEGDFGFTDLESSLMLGFPMPTVESPLLVTPAFAVHYLNGPDSPDLPPRLYSTGSEFRWLRPITQFLIADVAVGVGYYSDFETDSDEAIRITGRGLGIYKWSDTTTVALGVAYLDRDDVAILPVAGIIWAPTPEWYFELVVPRPKISRRLYHDGTIRELEYWGYVAAEFGGGQWAIATDDGGSDVLVLTDYRIDCSAWRAR